MLRQADLCVTGCVLTKGLRFGVNLKCMTTIATCVHQRKVFCLSRTDADSIFRQHCDKIQLCKCFIRIIFDSFSSLFVSGLSFYWCANVRVVFRSVSCLSNPTNTNPNQHNTTNKHHKQNMYPQVTKIIEIQTGTPQSTTYYIWYLLE